MGAIPAQDYDAAEVGESGLPEGGYIAVHIGIVGNPCILGTASPAIFTVISQDNSEMRGWFLEDDVDMCMASVDGVQGTEACLFASMETQRSR